MIEPPRDPLVVLVAPPGPAASALEEDLRAAGFFVDLAPDPAAIREGLAARDAALIVDVDAPRLDGMEIIARAFERNPLSAVVALVAPGNEERGVEAMERGATGVMVRPGSARQLKLFVRRAGERRDLHDRARNTEANLADRFALDRIVGESPGVVRARDALRRAALTDRKVLLIGEAGTGKELFARVLHQGSAASGGRFLMVEPGVIRAPQAYGSTGTLFIAGLGEPTRAAAQAVRTWFGPSHAGPEDEEAPGPRGVLGATRIVGAATVEPEGVADEFEVLRIPLPPLRERTGDMPLLVDHFLRTFNREHARRVSGMTRGALAHLEAWSWPGNVRELQAMLEGMVVFTDARRPLDVSDLPLALRDRVPDDRAKVTLSLGISLAEAEKRFLEETLRDVGYDRARAAETLGIGLRTLYRKLKEYEIG